MQLLPMGRRGGDGGVSPWRDWEALEDRMQRLLQTMTGEPTGEVGAWSPRLDFAEREDGFILTSELPGVDPADVEIEVEGNLLVMRGTKQSEQEHTQDRYHMAERRFGTFYREIALPTSADPDNVEAQFNHGVLTVKVGKRAEARGRRIPVRSQEKPPGQQH